MSKVQSTLEGSEYDEVHNHRNPAKGTIILYYSANPGLFPAWFSFITMNYPAR